MFKDKVVVITGGAHGIGKTTADAFSGENICIDGGMTRLMIYHGEHGWEFSGETGGRDGNI